jgi:hypothetical protein
MKNDKATTEESSGDRNGGRRPSLGAAPGSVNAVVRRLRDAGDTEAADMIDWLHESRQGFARRIFEHGTELTTLKRAVESLPIIMPRSPAKPEPLVKLGDVMAILSPNRPIVQSHEI